MSKRRRRAGFTLAEMMIAMLILVMVTGVAAGGVPAAISAYTNVMESANAQVLLSTTMTKLREELGTAAEIKSIADGRVVYESENGSESWIYCVTEAEAAADAAKKAGVYIREYADVVTDVTTYEHLLVSKSAANKNLYVTFGDMTMDYDKGVFTIENIEVKNGNGTVMADLAFTEDGADNKDNPDNPNGRLVIRVLAYR